MKYIVVAYDNKLTLSENLQLLEDKVNLFLQTNRNFKTNGAPNLIKGHLVQLISF